MVLILFLAAYFFLFWEWVDTSRAADAWGQTTVTDVVRMNYLRVRTKDWESIDLQRCEEAEPNQTRFILSIRRSTALKFSWLHEELPKRRVSSIAISDHQWSAEARRHSFRLGRRAALKREDDHIRKCFVHHLIVVLQKEQSRSCKTVSI